MKRTIIELEETNEKLPKSNPRFKIFAEAFGHDGDWIQVMLESISEIGGTSKKKTLLNLHGKGARDYLSFQDLLKGTQIVWNNESVSISRANELLYESSLKESDKLVDTKHWSALGVDFQLYLRRLRLK